jgi:NAD(P)-dependent dehydrogenase (short-subunit alcohol dehydrogenase family)
MVNENGDGRRAAGRTLSGAAAIVTGASQGIGRAIALELHRRGARVGLVARSQDALEKTVEAAGPNTVAWPADLAEEGAAEALVSLAASRWGRLDLLVHCAGAIHKGTMEEATLDQLDRLYRVNVRAPYALTQAALPMIKAARGQIAFVNSSITRAAKTGGRGQFAATQHALKAIADSLRDEVNRDGVRVVSIHPGTTATPRQAALHADAGADYAPDRLLQPEDVAAALCDALSLPATAEVTDIHLRQMLPSPGP